MEHDWDSGFSVQEYLPGSRSYCHETEVWILGKEVKRSMLTDKEEEKRKHCGPDQEQEISMKIRILMDKKCRGLVIVH